MKRNVGIVLSLTTIVVVLFATFGFGRFSQSSANKSTPQQIAKPATGSNINGTANTSGSGSTLTLETAAQHNSPSDCYLIIRGEVYDVSSYINKHPGGARNITSRCGQEVTGIFAAIHSNFAWNLLKNYQVGTIGTTATTQSANPTGIVSNSPEVLNNIAAGLQQQYPQAEILSVKPGSKFFVAKLIKNNALYELHVSADGTVLSEEVQNDEYDWNAWSTDQDDR